MSLSPYLSPSHSSCVQTTSPHHQGEGMALFSPGAAVAPSDHMAACRPPGLSPPGGGGDKDGGWVSPSNPWSCLLDLPGLHLRCGLCSVGFLCPSLWGARVFEAFMGSAALGCRLQPGQNVTQHRLEDSPCLQPETNVRAGQRCFTLLGMDDCSPGQVLDNLLIFLIKCSWLVFT